MQRKFVAFYIHFSNISKHGIIKTVILEEKKMKLQYKDLLIRDVTVDDAEQLCIWWNDGKVMEHAGFPNGLGISIETIRKQIEEKNTGCLNKNHIHIIIYIKNIIINNS